jgi:mannosylglycerate hydrolase
MVNVFLVNHTHWDREWYFSEQDSIVLSDILFTNVIDELKTHPDAIFVLDGQVSIVDEYLEIHPERKKDISELNEKGQLKIGPWFTQTDALHVQAESILRNGIIGDINSQKIGGRMNVGYLPDTFGFNAQMPVILNELGFKDFIFWRGIDPNKTKGFYFYWKGLNNKNSVLAMNMPQGYSTGMLLKPTHEYVDNRLDSGVDFILNHSTHKPNTVLIPTGNDQMDIIRNFGDKVQKINKIGKYNYRISDFETFEKEIAKDKLDDYIGEFIDPVLARIHRTCRSNRADTKIVATNLECKLVNQLEPLLVLANKYGIDLGTGTLMIAWEKLLRSQAHDSMAGSVVDSVNDDILHRLKEGNELADGLINTIEKLIALKLGLKENQVLLLNPSLRSSDVFQIIKVVTHWKDISFRDADSAIKLNTKTYAARKNIIKETPSGVSEESEPQYYVHSYALKAQLPPLGLKVIDFDNASHSNGLIEDSHNVIGNEECNISFKDNEVILNKGDKEIKDFIYLVDMANDGDTYDFSPLPNGKKIKLNFQSVKTLKSSQYQTMTLTGKGNLPANLNGWKQNKLDTQLAYKLTITWSDKKFNIKFKFTNNVNDHCLMLVFDSHFNKYHVKASVPFGYMERNSKVPDNWKQKYAEKPVPVWPLDNNVSLISADTTVSVFSKNVKQYKVENGALYLPLLNATGQLGKSNLVNRPGRASGDIDKFGHIKIPTPKAEANKSLEYKFLVNVSDTFDPMNVQKVEEKFKFTPVSYQLQGINVFTNRLDNKLQNDLVKVEKNLKSKNIPFKVPKNIAISACYPSFYSENNIIIRLFNPTSVAQYLDIPSNVKTVNAIEKEVPFNGELDSYDVISLKMPLL